MTNAIEEPFNRVIRIAAVIHILVALLLWDVGTHVNVLSLRHKLSANILMDKDESLAVEEDRRPQLRAIPVRSVGAHTIRRSHEHDRVIARRVFGNIRRLRKRDRRNKNSD